MNLVKMIRRTITVVKLEIYKMIRNKLFWLLPAILVVFVMLLWSSLRFATSEDFIGIASGFYLSTALLGPATMVVAILAVIAIGISIGDEFASGTIKYVLTKPVSRTEWFLGKILSISIIAIGLFLLSVLLCLALAQITYGFSDLAEKEYLSYPRDHLFEDLFISIGLSVLPVIVALVIGGAITLITERAAIAILVCLGFGLVSTLLGNFKTISIFLWQTYLTLPLAQTEAIAQGLRPEWLWNDLSYWAIAVPIITALIFIYLGVMILRKKEITV